MSSATGIEKPTTSEKAQAAALDAFKEKYGATDAGGQVRFTFDSHHSPQGLLCYQVFGKLTTSPVVDVIPSKPSVLRYPTPLPPIHATATANAECPSCHANVTLSANI